jgi:hypothetical protein
LTLAFTVADQLFQLTLFTALNETAVKETVLEQISDRGCIMGIGRAGNSFYMLDVDHK